MAYEFTSTKTRSIRKGPEVVSDDYVGSLPAGTIGVGDELFVYDADKGTSLKGDKWLHLLSPKVGWTAVIHRGLTQGDLVDTSVPPENPSDLKTVVKVVTTFMTEDGSLVEVETFPK